LRSYFILILLAAAAAGQGCATQGQATRAAEQAAMESEDDAACQGKGAPESPAYDACRKELAEARARQAAIQEQKRRDFDRVLGAGTEGQSNY
jgi:predicted secreted Zn-dependent protease